MDCIPVCSVRRVISIVAQAAWSLVEVHCHLQPHSLQGGQRCIPAPSWLPQGLGVVLGGVPLEGRNRSRQPCRSGRSECHLVPCTGIHLGRPVFPGPGCRSSWRSHPPAPECHSLFHSCDKHIDINIVPQYDEILKKKERRFHLFSILSYTGGPGL